MKKLPFLALSLLASSMPILSADNELQPIAQIVPPTPPATIQAPTQQVQSQQASYEESSKATSNAVVKAQSPEYSQQQVNQYQFNQSLLPSVAINPQVTSVELGENTPSNENVALQTQLNQSSNQISAQQQMQQQLLQQPPQYMQGKEIPLPTPTVGANNGSVAAAAKDILLTLSPEEIKELKIINERIARANAIEPVSFIPRVTSISTDLSAGSALPVVRVAPNQATFIIFEDITGQPWPLAAAPINPQPSSYYVSWFDATPTVYVQPQVSYGQSSIGVMLKDLPTPINVMLENGEAESLDSTRTYDARISIRIPLRGPNAKKSTVQNIDKIALYDENLQAFLDGVPPLGAIPIKTNNPRVEAWKFNNQMIVRTSFDSRTMYSKTLASSDGTRVYEMNLSPIISLTSNSETINVSLEL